MVSAGRFTWATTVEASMGMSMAISALTSGMRYGPGNPLFPIGRLGPCVRSLAPRAQLAENDRWRCRSHDPSSAARLAPRNTPGDCPRTGRGRLLARSLQRGAYRGRGAHRRPRGGGGGLPRRDPQRGPPPRPPDLGDRATSGPGRALLPGYGAGGVVPPEPDRSVQRWRPHLRGAPGGERLGAAMVEHP